MIQENRNQNLERKDRKRQEQVCPVFKKCGGCRHLDLSYEKQVKKKDKEEGSVLEVIIWPEPYCYAKTPEENKQRTEFAFTAEGVAQAADWLNEQYLQQKSLWELSKKF